ncbi:hypothetical protein [Ammoniphilus resinae]|uniref:Uncharacterized protein n=1 Tax=Ammoniphilus resinae TaxID=861532 RepID=A0ABS4GPH1_9BACL|nr:hypothetical protein [Ammoniphilus resinae]MBP1932168.1 hypothetical protein [Ammoniphilus resinae]
MKPCGHSPFWSGAGVNGGGGMWETRFIPSDQDKYVGRGERVKSRE